jgi:hypothetical protein
MRTFTFKLGTGKHIHITADSLPIAVNDLKATFDESILYELVEVHA